MIESSSLWEKLKHTDVPLFHLGSIINAVFAKTKTTWCFLSQSSEINIFFPVQLIDWGLPLEHVQLNCSQFLHNELNWKWKRLQRMNWMAAPRRLIRNRLFWTMSHAKLLSYFIPTIETWRWNWTRTLSENSKEQQPPFYSSPVWTVNLY